MSLPYTEIMPIRVCRSDESWDKRTSVIGNAVVVVAAFVAVAAARLVIVVIVITVLLEWACYSRIAYGRDEGF